MNYTGNSEFAVAGGIRELSFDEVGDVAGGPLPVALAWGAIAVGGIMAGAGGRWLLHEVNQS